MSELTRKDFLQSLVLGGSSLVSSSTGALGDASIARPNSPAGSIRLANEHFELTLSHGNGLTAKLTHLPSKIVWADGPYSYSFGTPIFTLSSSDATSATLAGKTEDGLFLVEHRFHVPMNTSWIEEEIVVRNLTPGLARGTFRCGFVMPVNSRTLAGYTFTAVPFRKEPRSKNISDFSLDYIMTLPRRSNLRGDTGPELRLYEDYISEGWMATNGTTGFVISKYNQSARDYAILDTVPGPALRWGGGGTFLSDSEGAIRIPAGAKRSFGVSRLTSYQGGMNEGFYTFRSEMESRGMGVPKGFNPPVHWNELYDNKLWWLPDNGQDKPENRAKYYGIDDLKLEAAKAQAIGCEALYCDPGWDTNFGSKIWDEKRLGKLSDFVALLRRDYGLKLSLHTPLSGWGNPSSYALECNRLHQDGTRGGLCGGSRQYIEETARRLNVLAEGGATYFMFDGTSCHLEDQCWDPTHGHSLPLTLAEHIDATNLVARKAHESYPQVSIEMHNQAFGGCPVPYVPLYYGYGSALTGPRGYDTIWGFEMMWDPLGDMRSGASRILYYCNMAYSIPIYIHIDLRSDNEHAIAFWWNASTCRYLGIGGTSQDPKINGAHFAAMREYKRLKAYYTAGTFFGVSELIHVHRHPTENSAVVNLFGIEGPITEFRFEPAKVGLPSGRSYNFSGGEAIRSGDYYQVRTSVPDMGHSLVEISES